MKKNLFIFLSLCCFCYSMAQTDHPYSKEVDRRYQHLNKQGIHILLDRVLPLAGLQSFNQGTRQDTSHVAHFKQAWSELYPVFQTTKPYIPNISYKMSPEIVNPNLFYSFKGSHGMFFEYF